MRGSGGQSVSSDDVGEAPNTITKTLSNRSVMIKELRRFSEQACEFCDRRFENWYDILVHNSKHIIIPLIKQKPQNCTACGWYCISEEHLNDHISIKHKELHNESKSRITDRILFEDNNPEFDSDKFTKDDAIDSLIQMECYKGNILENFVKSCKVDVEKFEPTLLDHKDVSNKSIVKKLEPSSEISESDDPIILLRPNREDVCKNETEYPSIHFDDLMKPGMFHCKHCFRRFPSRYEVIVHEIVHLNLSKAITNRRRRQENKKQVAIKVISTKSHKNKIKKSDLHDIGISDKYTGSEKSAEREEEKPSYKHHCSVCEMGCTSKKIKIAHEETCLSVGTKTMQMCDACTFSMMNKKKLELTTLGKICNLIAKPECERCGKLFPEMSLVRLTLKRQKTVNRIKFESNDDRQSKSHPRLTNRARLKNIQNRLKLINKYNALYNVVSFVVSVRLNSIILKNPLCSVNECIQSKQNICIISCECGCERQTIWR